MIATTARNATAGELVKILSEQQARKLDIVAPANKLRSQDGNLIVKGVEALVDETGVTQADGVYRPTSIADEGIGSKLGIPTTYMRTLRNRPYLYDANVNGWLRGKTLVKGDGAREVLFPADDRSFLLRCFRGDEGEEGVLRAFLSDRFGIIDHLDVLMASLQGIKEAGVTVQVTSADLTDRSMYVNLHAPAVAALAPVLLGDYESPFRNPAIEQQRHHGRTVEQWRAAAKAEGMDYEPGKEPIVHAGFQFRNSETGNGRFELMPRLVVNLCKNGLTIPLLAENRVHLGSRLNEGSVVWSDDTNRKMLDVITGKTRDLVKLWLSPEFLSQQVAEIEGLAGKPVANPEQAVKVLAPKLGFSQDEQVGIISHFLRSGQATAGGIANAITSFSQTLKSADRAEGLENVAMRALHLLNA
jgi:hypothetical protein